MHRKKFCLMKITCNSEQEYESIVEENKNKIIVVKFSANWCKPCKRLKPFLERIVSTKDDLILLDIDVDENEELCLQHNVKKLPHCQIKYRSYQSEVITGYKPDILLKQLREVISKKKI